MNSLYDNKYFHASKRFQRNKKRIIELSQAIQVYNPKTVLDVGCGIGVLVRHLRKQGIDAIGVDDATDLTIDFWKPEESYFSFASALSLPFPDASFDVVFSSDFFEHIPDEEIDQVVKEMKRVGKVVLARVAYEDILTEKQALYHVTNKPKVWWEKRLNGIILV